MRFVGSKPNSISSVNTMGNELLAATIFADAVGAQIEMEGMKAENTRRAREGFAPLHDQNSFMMLKDAMENKIAEAYR